MNRLGAATLIAVSLLAAGLAHAAEPQRPRETMLGYGKADSLKDGSLKAGSSPVARTSRCAAYGPGFQALDGSATCVRVFGGVRTDVTSRRTWR